MQSLKNEMTFDQGYAAPVTNNLRMSLIGGQNLFPRDPNKLPEPESGTMPPTQRSVSCMDQLTRDWSRPEGGAC
jgi:hypothetical protein